MKVPNFPTILADKRYLPLALYLLAQLVFLLYLSPRFNFALKYYDAPPLDSQRLIFTLLMLLPSLISYICTTLIIFPASIRTPGPVKFVQLRSLWICLLVALLLQDILMVYQFGEYIITFDPLYLMGKAPLLFKGQLGLFFLTNMSFAFLNSLVSLKRTSRFGLLISFASAFLFLKRLPLFLVIILYAFPRVRSLKQTALIVFILVILYSLVESLRVGALGTSIIFSYWSSSCSNYLAILETLFKSNFVFENLGTFYLENTAGPSTIGNFLLRASSIPHALLNSAILGLTLSVTWRISYFSSLTYAYLRPFVIFVSIATLAGDLTSHFLFFQAPVLIALLFSILFYSREVKL